MLDAAADLIGEVGFGRTSIEAIAERSGVARSTIYRHWSDRPELLIDAIDCKIAPVQMPQTGDLRNDLVTIVGELAERMGSEGGPMMVSLMAEARRDEKFAVLFDRFVGARFGRIKSIVESAVDRGDLPADVDSAQMVEDLVAPVFFRAFSRRGPLDEEFIKRHINRWVDAYRS